MRSPLGEEERSGMHMKKSWPLMGGVSALALFVLAGCAGITSNTELWREGQRQPVPPEIARLNDTLSRLAEQLKLGLVQIRVRRPAAEGEAEEGRGASGSGFVIHPDGLLVTNAHVVAGAEQVQVRLSNGRRVVGKVIGRDSRTDLALVKIDNISNLPVLPLGDSNSLRVGEFVLALGNPFGLEQSVSFGIVSRKGAPLTTASPGFDFIQTDAAVNPGNSGGPLVNMAGEVVGINSMAARNGSIGFAIPITLAKKLLPQLAEKGKVEWGWLGVGIDEVGEEEVAQLGLKDTRGVLVRRVMPDQPAAKGGMREKDVVLSIDGAPVESPRDLQRIIASTSPGKSVKLLVKRDQKDVELSVTVGLYEEPAERNR
jgi:S1-C subfamily serine protease